MTSTKLKKIVIKSLCELCEKDAVLIGNAVMEECINHKLAQYIEKYTRLLFPEITAIDVDVEYNKYEFDLKMMGQKPIRPDIVVHKRQSGNSENYLAVETKKDYSSKHDKNKIKHLVTNLNYSLGCLISYQPERAYLIVQFWQSGSNVWERQKYKKYPFENMNERTGI